MTLNEPATMEILPNSNVTCISYLIVVVIVEYGPPPPIPPPPPDVLDPKQASVTVNSVEIRIRSINVLIYERLGSVPSGSIHFPSQIVDVLDDPFFRGEMKLFKGVYLIQFISFIHFAQEKTGSSNFIWRCVMSGHSQWHWWLVTGFYFVSPSWVSSSNVIHI